MAGRSKKSASQSAQRGSTALSDIGLTHGRALWVLRELGFAQGASEMTFNYYIKSLRKLGLPFLPGENRHWSGRLARYSYQHLMELSLALTLRVYGAVPDSILSGIVKYRTQLNAIYVQSYEARRKAMTIRMTDEVRISRRLPINGVFLDLQINFSGGTLVGFGPPRVIGGGEAIEIFATGNSPSRAFCPIHISDLAERVARVAEHAPVIRRGRVLVKSST